jgi:hypothetical protein
MITAIPYRVSRKQDPTKFSLLLDSPLDVRLLLLEAMFIHNDSISMTFSYSRMKHILPSSSLEIAGFAGLLLSCRQLYCEAVKILFARNRFQISSEFPDFGCWPDFNVMELFMDVLGSNAQRLRHLTLLLHPHQIGYNQTHLSIDLVHLLRLKWEYTHCVFDVGIYRAEDYHPVIKVDLTKFNNIVSCLGNPSHELSRYAKHRRLYLTMRVPQTLDDVEVSFRPPRTHGYSNLLYTVRDNGQSVQNIRPSQRPSTLTSIPEDIRKEIVDLVNGLDNTRNHEVRVCLDRASKFRRYQNVEDGYPHLNLNLALTCRIFRDTILDFYSRVWFSIHFNSSRVQAHLPPGSLNNFLQHELPISRPRLNVLRAHLELEDSSSQLGPARINIKPLLLFDLKCWECRKYTERSLHLRFPNSEENDKDGWEDAYSEQWVDYLEVRARAVNLLLHFGGEHAQRMHDDCPDIWVYGDGSVKLSYIEKKEQDCRLSDIWSTLCKLPYKVDGILYTNGSCRQRT